MAESFDPYHKWLGISPKDQPPNHYRLLAIELFESDPDVIEAAADQRMAHVRTYQTGQNSALSQRILNELSAAKLCLLDPTRRAGYDRQLREKLAPADAPRQARPIAIPEPAVVIAQAASTSGVHKRLAHKKSVWNQAAVIAAAGAAVVLLALGSYWMIAGGSRPIAAVAPEEGSKNAAKPASIQPDQAERRPKVDRKPSPAAESVPVAKPAVRAIEPDFEIIEATWGTGDKWVNVTDGVRARVKDNRLMMMVWSNLFGSPPDPAEGSGKVLRIRYRSRGKQYLVDYPDYFFVYLDGNPLAPPTDSPDGLELLEARYGAGVTYVDVLSQAREQLRDGRFSVPANRFAPTTAEELAKENINAGTFMVLWIRYRNGTGEHFTYAWNDTPVVIESCLPQAAGPPVDILAQIDLNRDVIEGDWKLENKVLHIPGTHSARIQLPLDAPQEYALAVVAESNPEIMDISVLLPISDQQVMSVIDGYGGITTGLQVVNGGRADGNPSHRWRCARLFEQGRPNTLVYIMRHTSVRILRDGAEILRWSGDPRGFSLADAWKVPNGRRVALEAYETPYRVSKVEIVPLVPENSPLFVNLEQGTTVDLLKNIDADRDLARGNWQYDGQSLISPSDRHSVVDAQLPAVVPADYQLDVVAQRESGDDCLSITFPIAGTYGTLNIDGGKGTLSGLQMIDGKDFTSNETTRQTTIFADGKAHSITLRVHKDHVRAECDAQPIVDWNGDVNRLKPSQPAPYNDRIYVGNWYSRYRLTKIELTALGAEPEAPSPLTGAPAATAEPSRPTLGDLVQSHGPRADVPDDEASKKARQQMQKKYASDLSSAKTLDQKRKLARRLMDEAGKAEGGDAAVYALLLQATDLAEAAGDLDVAWQVTDELATRFKVDAVALKQQSLTDLGKAAKSPEQAHELAIAACRLLAAAVANADSTAVKKIAAQAQSLAKRSKDAALIKEIAARTRDAGKLAADFDAVTAAQETLKTMPDDAHANYLVGHYELCAAGDWEGALPKLANGDDAPWKKLAQDELEMARNAATAQKQVAVADAWSSQATKEVWRGRHYLEMRAAQWYGRALPSLVGDERDRTINRLKTLLATDEGLPAWELFKIRQGQQVGDMVRLNRGGKVETLINYGGPIEVSFVARTDGLNIRLFSHTRESVIWNWELNTSELRVTRPDGRIIPSPTTPLEPNRWYQFRYRITPFNTTILVDGVQIFVENHAYGEFRPSPVGVLSAGDSVVDVKRLVVKPIE